MKGCFQRLPDFLQIAVAIRSVVILLFLPRLQAVVRPFLIRLSLEIFRHVTLYAAHFSVDICTTDVNCIQHFHVNHNAFCLRPASPKFYKMTVPKDFIWVYQSSQETSMAMVMQFFFWRSRGGGGGCIGGVLWALRKRWIDIGKGLPNFVNVRWLWRISRAGDLGYSETEKYFEWPINNYWMRCFWYPQ